LPPTYGLTPCERVPPMPGLFQPTWGTANQLSDSLRRLPNRSRVRSASPPRLASVMLIVPPMAILAWCVTWPMVCSASPRLQYKFGGTRSRQEAVRRVLSHVQVGDRYEDVRGMLPEYFPEVAPVGPAGSMTSHGSNSFALIVRDGIIIDLRLGTP